MKKRENQVADPSHDLRLPASHSGGQRANTVASRRFRRLIPKIRNMAIAFRVRRFRTSPIFPDIRSLCGSPAPIQSSIESASAAMATGWEPRCDAHEVRQGADTIGSELRRRWWDSTSPRRAGRLNVGRTMGNPMTEQAAQGVRPRGRLVAPEPRTDPITGKPRRRPRTASHALFCPTATVPPRPNSTTSCPGRAGGRMY